jgi:cytochrome c biogenesis protein CcmG/thiol:disulfide interchange protein DsbE
MVTAQVADAWTVYVLLCAVGAGLFALIVAIPWRRKGKGAPARLTKSGRLIIAGVAAFFLLPLLLVSGFVGMKIYRASSQADPAIGRAAPPLSFHLLADGSVHTLADYRGNVVLVNVWATWCPPCRVELPGLDALQREYAGRKVIVLAVTNEEPETVRGFHDLAGMRVVKAYLTPQQRSFYMPRGMLLPTTYLVDGQGILRAVFVGRRPEWFFRYEVRKWM